MAAAFDPFAPGAGATLILLGSRIASLVLIAPVFSSKIIPKLVKMALVVVLTAVLEPMVLARAPMPPRITPETMLAESLIGFALGLGAAVFVAAAEMAGEIITMQVGLSGAAILDPNSGQQGPALGQFVSMFAVTLLVTMDAHLIMLRAVADSTRLIPVGTPVHVAAGLGAMVKHGSMLFGVGLRFAAPVVGAVLLANTALAILTRAAPALNVFSVAFPIQIGIGLVAFAATIPLIALFFSHWRDAYGAAANTLLGALAFGR